MTGIARDYRPSSQRSERECGAGGRRLVLFLLPWVGPGETCCLPNFQGCIPLLARFLPVFPGLLLPVTLLKQPGACPLPASSVASEQNTSLLLPAGFFFPFFPLPWRGLESTFRLSFMSWTLWCPKPCCLSDPRACDLVSPHQINVVAMVID